MACNPIRFVPAYSKINHSQVVSTTPAITRHHSACYCRTLGPMPGSHETALGDSRVRHGCLGNMMAGLRYWVAGSGVYRHPRGTGIALDDILSFCTLLYVSILRGFDHTYHSAILITSESTALIITTATASKKGRKHRISLRIGVRSLSGIL